MFWDKKEGAKGLPDLPPARFMPPALDKHASEAGEDESDTSEEKHGLPSFPDSPMQRGFSQSAIKDAVTHESTEEDAESRMQNIGQPLPQSAAALKTVEVDEWSPHQSLTSSLLPPPPAFETALREPAPMPALAAPRPARAPKNTEIFVKIDKFYSAKKALDVTSTKLDEIDALLHKIRETKMREEQELAAWERDLATIKARIKEVTETIFEKVE